MRADYQPNPFATRFVRPGAVPYRFASTDPSQQDSRLASLVERFAEIRFGLIVGPHGSGKSTLLRSLEQRLRETFGELEIVRLAAPSDPRSWRRWSHRRRCRRFVVARQSQLAPHGVLVMDGAEQLSRGAMATVLRTARRRSQAVLATSHRTLPALTTLHRTVVDADLVRSLTESLLQQTSPAIVASVRRELSRRTLPPTTNLRDLWFDLYDVVQPHTFSFPTSASE